MIVITLSKVPPSLRGVLTRWYQEIQTGVYVGSVTARIRDQLWDRIIRDIGRGEATMVYSAANELGYQFKTTRADHSVVDLDGLPFMKKMQGVSETVKPGFSDAAKFRQARKHASQSAGPPAVDKPAVMTSFVSLDIETTGLDVGVDHILSIGVVKQMADRRTETLSLLIDDHVQIPPAITKLTGITQEMIEKEGQTVTETLARMNDFIGELPIVGYNLRFDLNFLTAVHQGREGFLKNRMIDLLPMVKRAQQFLANYKMNTVLAAYDIVNVSPHHALSDARATLDLANKLIENGVELI